MSPSHDEPQGMNERVEDLAGWMADYLEREADAIVERWIDWLVSRVGTRTVAALPRQAIRNHIPPVLHSIAAYIRAPVEAARSAMLGHLELHANLRRGQGYDLDELLTEFDGLAQMVTRELREHLAEYPGAASAPEVVEAFDRVATGLRAIGFVTVELFRSSEVDQRKRLASRLEEFARTIAHELRSPLHTASLGVSLLREGGPGAGEERHERYVAMIDKSLRRTTDLLDNLRQLAIVESGRTRESQFARVQRLVQETLEQLGPAARERNVEVRVEGDVPDVAVDHITFQLATVNLASNAIKYSDPNKDGRWVTLSFEEREIEHDLNHLVVKVSDNGLGIAPDYMHRVFQRHVRVHPEAAEGTGLGLSITRHLVLERGGEIDLQSEEGVGTTVTFELPCHPGSVTEKPGVDPTEETVKNAVTGVSPPEPSRSEPSHSEPSPSDDEPRR